MIEQLLNIPRLYTAIAEFSAILLFINFFPKRFNKITTFIIGTISLVSLIAFHLWADTWHDSFWILGMITVFIMIYIIIFSISKLSYYKIFFISMLAFILSEFIASVEWQLEYFLITLNSNNVIIKTLTHSFFEIYNLRITLLMIISYAIIISVFFILESRYFTNKKYLFVSSRDILSTALIGIVIFSISNISFLNINTPITSNKPHEMFYIRTLVDFVGIVILYSQREHKYTSEKELEIYTMTTLLNKQYEHYQLSHEANEIINQKYHDIKNHINIIKMETDYKKKMEHIEKLEEEIKVYHIKHNTNNHVLDIIINSKQELMNKHHIIFTCVANGEILKDISVIDMVSIFGNALDNAIESLELIEDFSRRLLKITIFRRGNFNVISVENYYENALSYAGMELISTKGNSIYRGYGIKSIRTAVEKYNGTVQIETSNNWFKLIILIPVEQ